MHSSPITPGATVCPDTGSTIFTSVCGSGRPRLHLHAGFPGGHVKTSVELIRQGKVPTADLLGEVVTVEGFGDALRLLARDLPGRDAIRLALTLTGDKQA